MKLQPEELQYGGIGLLSLKIRPARFGGGVLNFGDSEWPGGSKVLEEMGELAQVFGKLLALRGGTSHWDGSDLRERLVEETADVTAALAFFVQKNDLDGPQWEQRVQTKRALFEKWHRGEE